MRLSAPGIHLADRWSARDLARELGGGFGDIGLLAPLAVALITLNHLNATAVLAGAGLFYISTSLVFRLPVPVQPLKAVSAIAIAAGMSPHGIAAAGLEIGAAFVVLSVTGIADWLARIFTPPVVRGVQLSIGLLLARAAVDLMLRKHQLAFSTGPLEGNGIGAGLLVGLLVLFVLLLFEIRQVAGGSLLVLGAGLLLGLVAGIHAAPRLGLGPEAISLSVPSAADFLTAFWVLTLPQVGLSIGNSLMATSSAAQTYFGQAGRRVTPGRLALSMGLANLVVSPLSGMPMCHGAGGMTAHYRMGARSGIAIAIYGSVLLLLGLALGGSGPGALGLVPVAVLGGFLLYVGIQHAALVSDLKSHREFLIAGTVAALSVATGNISGGVVAGLLVTLLLTRVEVVAGRGQSIPADSTITDGPVGRPAEGSHRHR